MLAPHTSFWYRLDLPASRLDEGHNGGLVRSRGGRLGGGYDGSIVSVVARAGNRAVSPYAWNLNLESSLPNTTPVIVVHLEGFVIRLEGMHLVLECLLLCVEQVDRFVKTVVFGNQLVRLRIKPLLFLGISGDAVVVALARTRFEIFLQHIVLDIVKMCASHEETAECIPRQ